MEVGPLARMIVAYAAGHTRGPGTDRRGADQTGGRCRRALLHPGPDRGAGRGDRGGGRTVVRLVDPA